MSVVAGLSLRCGRHGWAVPCPGFQVSVGLRFPLGGGGVLIFCRVGYLVCVWAINVNRCDLSEVSGSNGECILKRFLQAAGFQIQGDTGLLMSTEHGQLWVGGWEGSGNTLTSLLGHFLFSRSR